jgi:hypothetical protein
VFAGKKSAQIREILISESAWEEMTCLFAPSLVYRHNCKDKIINCDSRDPAIVICHLQKDSYCQWLTGFKGDRSRAVIYLANPAVLLTADIKEPRSASVAGLRFQRAGGGDRMLY